MRRDWTLDSGGFPKIRPCRWRNAEPSPPAYVSARKGTGKQRLGGMDPGWTPEASTGVHLGISVGSLERTTPSMSSWIASEGRYVSPSGVSHIIVLKQIFEFTVSSTDIFGYSADSLKADTARGLAHLPSTQIACPSGRARIFKVSAPGICERQNTHRGRSNIPWRYGSPRVAFGRLSYDYEESVTCSSYQVVMRRS